MMIDPPRFNEENGSVGKTNNRQISLNLDELVMKNGTTFTSNGKIRKSSDDSKSQSLNDHHDSGVNEVKSIINFDGQVCSSDNSHLEREELNDGVLQSFRHLPQETKTEGFDRNEGSEGSEEVVSINRELSTGRKLMSKDIDQRGSILIFGGGSQTPQLLPQHSQSHYPTNSPVFRSRVLRQERHRLSCETDTCFEDGFESEFINVARGTSDDYDDFKGTRLLPCSLRNTFLRPDYSLRKQLFLTFGLVSAAALLFVIMTSVATTEIAKRRIENESSQKLTAWFESKLGSNPRYVAESISLMLDSGVTPIMVELLRDRFVGYPDHPGYADDSNVPFFDIETNRNRYPLESPHFQHDWEFEQNFNEETCQEHIQQRCSWFGPGSTVGTSNAVYRIQGQCNPNRNDDPKSSIYYPNCTDANNDMTTGGVVQPTATNFNLFQKAKSLNFALKALYEYHQNAKFIGFFFANDGAGSVLSFPAIKRSQAGAYISIGCEWMAKPNPLDPSRPIGTPEQIKRCHPAGTKVRSREYNPLERGWCRDQALNPDKTHVVGPYTDAFANHSLLTIGRAAYDRITNELIACTLVDVTTGRLSDVIETVGSKSLMQIALLRWDNDGTLVASAGGNDEEVVIDKQVFENIKSRVNFLKTWDASDVHDAFDTTFHRNGKIIGGHPIPVPPTKYDESYSPDFMVIVSMNEDDALIAVRDVEGDINDVVHNIIQNVLVIGFTGLLLVLSLISGGSLYLTKPLGWMNRVGRQIVDDFGQNVKSTIDYGGGDDDNESTGSFVKSDRKQLCSPKTEVDYLVREFRKMVANFSGDGTAKVDKYTLVEVENPFTLTADFDSLYESRENPDFQYKYAKPITLSIFGKCVMGEGDTEGETEEEKEEKKRKDDFREVSCRIHLGRNVHIRDSEDKLSSLNNARDSAGRNEVLSSPLFWLIICCILVPLLLAMVLISALVTWTVSSTLPNLILHIEESYLEIAAKSLELVADLRAGYAEQVIYRSLRDLNVFSRVANWVFMGALVQSSSFTQMNSGVDECKSVRPPQTCSYLKDVTSSCDCALDPDNHLQCDDFDPKKGRRHSQKLWFAGQSQDAWSNGDRNFTTYPKLSYSPNTTDWWVNVSILPGSDKREEVSGYETTYDRLRVSSALSVIQMPLYNYHTISGSVPHLGLYEAFEADGMLLGYTGCSHGYATQFSKWKSTKDNGASEIRPDVCPLGKYGYDARCSHWYGTGKKFSQEDGVPLYVTAPYEFATSSIIGQSATMPLNDTNSGKYFGQAVIDFLPGEIVDSLIERTSLAPQGFPILISSKVDNLGTDTVVGPGYSLEDMKGSMISDLVLPNDCSGDGPECRNRQEFDDILKDMRAGNHGRRVFTRKNKKGEEEKVSFAYAPVFGTSLIPKNSSDFTRGVDVSKSLIFSLALAEPYPGLLRPFEDIRSTVQQQGTISLIFLVFFVLVSAALVTFNSWRVNVSVTVPISQLLAVVKKINRCDIKEDMPEIYGGSIELSRVYGTFENLYKVVRFANSAYFSGDLEKAYEVMVDALALFERMKNDKAVGVATNNLGNMMLTMYRTAKMKPEEKDVCGMNKDEIIERGIKYFDEAIHLGEEAINRTDQEKGFSHDYLIFMQQLSNRYFNRAMFLLTVRDDHRSPKDAESLGLSDLTIARDMDIEFIDQCTQEGFTFDEEERFNLLLGRIRGLILLREMSYSFDWNIADLLEDARKLLLDANLKPDHNLFRDLGPTGQMQLLDSSLIRYWNLEGKSSARVAIRMLVEDEYIIPDAGVAAINSLIKFVKCEEKKLSNNSPIEVKKKLLVYRSFFEAIEKNNFLGCPSRNIKGDVTMETF